MENMGLPFCGAQHRRVNGGKSSWPFHHRLESMAESTVESRIIVAAVLVAPAHSLPASAAESACRLRCGPYAVQLNANGAVTRIEKQGSTPITVAGTADNAGSLVYGKTSLALEKPAEMKSSPTGCTLAYNWRRRRRSTFICRSGCTREREIRWLWAGS